MRTRRVNWYIYEEDSALKLRFIEMHDQDTSRLAIIAKDIEYHNVESQVEQAFKDPQENNGHIDPFLMHILGMQENPELREYIRDTIGERSAEAYKPILIKQLQDLTYQQLKLESNLIGSYGRFNRIHYTIAHQELLDLYSGGTHHKEVTAKTYPFSSYWIQDVSFVLPSDTDDLLAFIGCLDSAMHSDDIHAPRHGYQTFNHFFDTKPESDNHDSIITSTFKGDTLEHAQELSIFAAECIIAKYEADSETLSAYAEAMDELKEMLETKPESLTKVIRDKFFPDPTVEQFLAKHCENKPVMSAMLNPAVSHTQAAQDVINSLRSKLAKKPDSKLTLKEDETGILNVDADIAPIQRTPASNLAPDDKNKHKSSHPIHNEIAGWFEAFAELRTKLWGQYVETLYGHPADDGGYYSSNYTEVTLMKECNMHLSPTGFMQLDINKENGSAYNRHYAAGEANHDILEREMRMAFDLLGLNFLPQLDFHNGRILFDAESSKELMNHGMHFSEEYFKKLMQTTHHHRLFKPNTQGNTHPIQSVPTDPKNLLSSWAHPGVDQAEEIAVRTISIA